MKICHFNINQNLYDMKIIILVTKGDLVKNKVFEVREMSFDEKRQYYLPLIKSVKESSCSLIRTAEKNINDINKYSNAIQRKAYTPIKGRLKNMPFPMHDKGICWDFLPEQKNLF